MPGEEDADMEFYKAFKLLYVDLPVPEDELPCEQIRQKRERTKMENFISIMFSADIKSLPTNAPKHLCCPTHTGFRAKI